MLKILKIFLFFSIFFSFSLEAKDFFENSALTSLPVSHHTVWSPFENTATLGNLSQTEIQVLYLNRFGLKEMSSKALYLAFPNEYLDVGFAINYFGFHLFNEKIIGLAFARKFSEKLIFSTQFDYYSIHIHEHDTKNTPLIQIGLLSKPTEKIRIGFQTFNPFFTDIISEYNAKKIPSIFSLGSSISLSKESLLGLEISHDIHTTTRLTAAFEYLIQEYILIKIASSYKNKNIIPAIGLNLNFTPFVLGFNAEIHQVLGVFSNLNLSFQL